MNEKKRFEEERRKHIAAQGRDPAMRELGREFLARTAPYRYSYGFTWLGRPIIQFPQDMVAMQEIIWEVKPDLIVETGIAHGGSLIFYASMLELLGGDGLVVGIDVDIRSHNREEIEGHAMAQRIRMIEASSVAEETVHQVRKAADGRTRALVVLDSNHTHEHVLRELELYSPFVGKGSYLVVFDTAVEEMPADFYGDRPWGKGDNPLTAVREFLARNDRFVADRSIEDKLLITVAPGGYLRCVRDE